MSRTESAIRNVVVANRILANEGVVDAYGHVSLRHPDNPNRYLLSRSRSPEHVEPGDIMEFDLESNAVGGDKRPAYIERFIHGSIYARRPEVNAVVHSHADDVLPFSISLTTPMRPVIHTAGVIGRHIPVWDIRDKFGDTNLLVTNAEQGKDLAGRLELNNVVLMSGHGFATAGRSLHEAVRIAVYLAKNARIYLQALSMGKVRLLSDGEVEHTQVGDPDATAMRRAWEYWAKRAGCADMLDDV